MAEEISYEDIVQQYKGTVVLYKGEPVYISGVSVDPPYKVNFTYIITQKRGAAVFNMEEFKPPALRIGMVNIMSSVVYCSRQPRRVMQSGISNRTLGVEYLATHYPEGQAECRHALQRLNVPALGEAMVNDYPPFEECLEFVKNFKGAMAWDKQFAIDSERQIHYKTSVVGNLPRNCTRVERIQFDAGYEHLEILLGDNCGKTLSAIEA